MSSSVHALKPIFRINPRNAGVCGVSDFQLPTSMGTSHFLRKFPPPFAFSQPVSNFHCEAVYGLQTRITTLKFKFSNSIARFTTDS
jgi:hypothetical protein